MPFVIKFSVLSKSPVEPIIKAFFPKVSIYFPKFFISSLPCTYRLGAIKVLVIIKSPLNKYYFFPNNKISDLLLGS